MVEPQPDASDQHFARIRLASTRVVWLFEKVSCVSTSTDKFKVASGEAESNEGTPKKLRIPDMQRA